jgi:uncharacterized protein (DUF1778 family)
MAEEFARTLRIEARVASDELVLVRRAAELRGCSIGEFATDAVLEAAERAIEATHIIRLAPASQDRLAELLLAPPALPPAMERARAAHARLVVGRRGGRAA